MMGGAVVAALSAWRDKEIIKRFEEANLGKLLQRRKRDIRGGRKETKNYLKEKTWLLKELNSYFLQDDSYHAWNSPF